MEVESLPGLVDAAIDMDERVIEDRDDGRFVVFGDGINYVYVPPASSRAPGTSSETTATEGTGDPDRESASERRTTAAAAKQNGDDSPS